MGRNETRISELVNWTDRQREAFDSLADDDFILYGGARGGGKSYWLRWSGLLLLLHYGRRLNGVVGGLFCETYPELRDRQVSKIENEFPDWMGELKDSQIYGLAYHIRAEYGGGVLALRNLDDPSKYKSAEFAFVLIDELTATKKETFDTVRGSLRWPGIARPKFLAGSNPDGPGNLWVRELWIEQRFPAEMQEIAERFKFVRSLPTDNPHLDAAYWQQLRSQPPDVQRAWIDGDWYVFQGQAFKAFRRDVHIIRPMEIPSHYIRMTGLDWGYANPFCHLWAAKNPDNGRVIIYREAYETGLTDPRQAALIKSMEDPDEKIRKRYADPSMWTKRTETDTPTSSADTYMANGLYLTPAVNDRINGKRKVDKLLEPLPDGKPGLMIFETCPNLARTLSSLVYDKTHPEDVDSRGEDHCLVAGTMVTTDKGPVPIEDIRIGDRVLTRIGFCPVAWAGMTSISAKVCCVTLSNGQELIGTGEHPVFVKGKGFISIDTLRYDDIIIDEESVLWEQKLLCSMELNSDGIPIQRTGRAEPTLLHQERRESGELGSCIRRYGKAITGKSRQGTTFITETGIRSTTTRRTWNAFHLLSTYQLTRDNTCPEQNTWNGSDRWLLSGTDLHPAGNGTSDTELKHGLGERVILSGVATAGKNSKHETAKLNIAQIIAGHQQEESQRLITSKEFALCAERVSLPTGTAQVKLAPDYAVRVCDVLEISKTQPVYNLEIVGQHEFFANGVLVHNCYDALRYLLTDDRGAAPERQDTSNPWLNLRRI